MRICYIGDGDSIHNQFMIDWFVQAGHEVLFLTDTPGAIAGCDVRQVAPRYGYKFLRHLYAAFRVRRAIQAWNPDIVHAHNIVGYGYWGALCGFRPLLMTAWGTDINIFSKRNPIVTRIVQKTLMQADWITADADALCEETRRLTGQKKEVRLLQWGVDLSQFESPVSEAIRQKTRQDAEFVFLSNRRLREWYNIETILRAFAQALPKMEASRLVVIGDDRLTTQLKNLASDLGIAAQVWFAGWMEHQAMLDALRSCDVYLSVPSTDSTALSLLEAFAARRPVIVSNLEACREWVKHQENGLLVEPKNLEQLAQAMIWMRRHPEMSSHWGKLNRRIVEERGDREREMKKLEFWYRQERAKRHSS